LSFLALGGRGEAVPCARPIYETSSSHYEGWPRVIGWMQAIAEKGEAVARRPPISPAPRV